MWASVARTRSERAGEDGIGPSGGRMEPVPNVRNIGFRQHGIKWPQFRSLAFRTETKNTGEVVLVTEKCRTAFVTDRKFSHQLRHGTLEHGFQQGKKACQEIVFSFHMGVGVGFTELSANHRHTYQFGSSILGQQGRGDKRYPFTYFTLPQQSKCMHDRAGRIESEGRRVEVAQQPIAERDITPDDLLQLLEVK